MTDRAELTASYHRLVSDRRFWERFSELFLGRNGAVRRHFENVPPAHRRELLQRSLTTLFDHAANEPGAGEALDDLVRPDQGGRQEIPETLYSLWLVSLLSSVRDCDPHYSADLERAWRRTMEAEVAHLLRRSRELLDESPEREMTAGAAIPIPSATPG